MAWRRIGEKPGLLSIRRLGINFSDILNKIQYLLFTKIHLKNRLRNGGKIFNQNTIPFIHENASENIDYEMAAI